MRDTSDFADFAAVAIDGPYHGDREVDEGGARPCRFSAANNVSLLGLGVGEFALGALRQSVPAKPGDESSSRMSRQMPARFRFQRTWDGFSAGAVAAMVRLPM